MKKALRSLIRRLARHRSGNAAMLVALGMPLLIGSTGLAVDTAQWFLWKRELQHAADQAAIGGAWALTKRDKDAYKGQTLYYIYRANQEFDSNSSITASFIKDRQVSLASYAGGSNNSVIVSATAEHKLPFSGYVLGRSAVIRVRAQASFAAGGTYNACLVALNEEDQDTISIGGNANVTAQCGLAALSCADGAITIDGSASVTTGSIATCGTANVPTELEGVVTEGLTNLYDAYADLVPPENNISRTYNCSGKGNNKSASLLPGRYVGGIEVKCTTVLASGIYVIDGGVLDLAANYNVTGTGVMFVLKNGAKIKFGGNGNGNKITLTPMQEAHFVGTAYESQAAKLQGILVFEDRNNNPSNPGHLLNGNSQSLIEGLIYLPSGEMTVLGTANVASQCLQVSAQKIKISGNANLQTLCPTEQTTTVGASSSNIRLIA